MPWILELVIFQQYDDSENRTRQVYRYQYITFSFNANKYNFMIAIFIGWQIKKQLGKLGSASVE